MAAFHDALLRRLSLINDLGTSATAAAQAKAASRYSQSSNSGDSGNWTGGTFSQNVADPGGARSAILNTAKQYIGTNYVWGGSNPSQGFDCSGLVQYAYSKAGIKLPRVSNQQAMSGVRTSLDRLKPGDLVAWDNSSRNRGADHIAIYAGNGMVIEAPGRGKQLRTRRVGANEGAWGVAIQGL